MSKITVIIPCYNAESYIERCIESLNSQTFNDFSVVFVDDCSKDNTVEKINTFIQKTSLNVVLLRNETNMGPAISRNKGISFCTTEYVTFCDCDDWYEPDFIKEMYGMIHKHQSDIAFCGYNVVDEKYNVQKRPIIDNEKKLAIKEALLLESDSLCMMMVKTKIMKETLLPDIRNGEDMAVVPLLIAKSKSCSATNMCLYNYFRRSNSASQTPTMKVVDSICRSFDYTKRNFVAEYDLELEYIGIKNMLYPAVINAYSVGYKKKETIQILKDFEKAYPKWIKNPYFKLLSQYKKIVLKLLRKKCYLLIRIIALMRSAMLR